MADNFNLRAFLTENKLTKNAQILNEEKFYAPDYIAQKYGAKAKEIEQNIYDAEEAENNPNLWDHFTSLETPEEVDTFIQGFIDEEVNEARVEGFDENQKAFEVSFINKYGGGDSRILNAETPEQAEEVFTDIFVNNPDFVQSIKSIKPYQVPAAKPKAEPQPGLEGVNYNSIELDGIDPDDSPDFVDAYVVSAEFEDGTPLSEKELEQLTDELYQSGELADMAAQSLYESNKPVKEASYKAPSNSKEAQHLRKGDIIGSGDEVVSVSAGAKTPAGKVEVTLKTKSGSTKTSLWGKTTKIGLKKVEESKLTAREQSLVEMVQNALGIAPQAVAEEAPIAEEIPMAEDEMVQENPLPKYKNIDELMSNIEHGTNEAAHKYKMDRMKEVAEALEAKVTSLEEGENAEHIDQKAVKQMRKDIQALRKAEEKLRKEFDKKFANKKEPKQDK